MQRPGLYLGSILGTTIRMELSFLFVMALFVFLWAGNGQGIEHALLWAPVLFFSVLVHELSHAAMIGMLGFGPSEVVLSGLGGHTWNERRAQPWQNLLISVVGPLSSFGVALVFLILSATVPFFRTDAMMVPLSSLMVMANVLWGVFNFLPILPLDGGNVFYNFIGIFAARNTAFKASIWVSILTACAVLALSLAFRQIFIAFIAGMLLYQNWLRWTMWRDQSRVD